MSTCVNRSTWGVILTQPSIPISSFTGVLTSCTFNCQWMSTPYDSYACKLIAWRTIGAEQHLPLISDYSWHDGSFKCRLPCYTRRNRRHCVNVLRETSHKKTPKTISAFRIPLSSAGCSLSDPFSVFGGRHLKAQTQHKMNYSPQSE